MSPWSASKPFNTFKHQNKAEEHNLGNSGLSHPSQQPNRIITKASRAPAQISLWLGLADQLSNPEAFSCAGCETTLYARQKVLRSSASTVHYDPAQHSPSPSWFGISFRRPIAYSPQSVEKLKAIKHF